MSKTLALVLVLVFLTASSIAIIQPVKAQYIGDIVINQDGSISPLTAPIQRNGNLYTLISDIEGAVNTYHSNVILDGSGHTINEFLAESVSNITVKNFKVTMKNQFSENVGMMFNNTSNSWITTNTVTGFWSIYALNGLLFAGIYVKGGNANTFTANTILDNLNGIDFVDTSNNLFIGNNVTSYSNRSPYSTLISFIKASNNSIYQNNLINGTYQAKASNSTNIGLPTTGMEHTLLMKIILTIIRRLNQLIQHR
jgi:parallel beta-helix repeat protein